MIQYFVLFYCSKQSSITSLAKKDLLLKNLLIPFKVGQVGLQQMRRVKIARRTTGAKGCNFLAGFLQVSQMFLKYILKVFYKYLTNLLQVSKKLLTTTKFLFDKTLTSNDSSLLQVSTIP